MKFNQKKIKKKQIKCQASSNLIKCILPQRIYLYVRKNIVEKDRQTHGVQKKSKSKQTTKLKTLSICSDSSACLIF